MEQNNTQPVRDTYGESRRSFLRAAGVAGLGAAASKTLAAATESVPPVHIDGVAPAVGSSAGLMPMRPFGRHTDVLISALGLGGHHLGDAGGIEEAITIVRQAVEGGITFFDNCWEYHNGKSENWMGRALRGYRDKVFLMTKVCTHGRDAGLAMEMLEQSLRRLQTDHLDLWQVHGVTYDNDPDLAYAKGGVLEAFERAKKDGKVRFCGFTGHKDPAIHHRMLTMGYPFDAVQMPLNPLDGTFRSFEQIVLPEARKRGVAVLGMKSMGGTAEAIKKGVLKADEALRYAMSLPVATTITGIDSLGVLEQNLHVAHGFKPYAADEMDVLRQRVSDQAADGKFELYKVSLKYDNPEARLPHHFPLDPMVKEVKDMFQNASSASPH